MVAGNAVHGCTVHCTACQCLPVSSLVLAAGAVLVLLPMIESGGEGQGPPRSSSLRILTPVTFFSSCLLCHQVLVAHATCPTWSGRKLFFWGGGGGCPETVVKLERGCSDLACTGFVCNMLAMGVHESVAWDASTAFDCAWSSWCWVIVVTRPCLGVRWPLGGCHRCMADTTHCLEIFNCCRRRDGCWHQGLLLACCS